MKSFRVTFNNGQSAQAELTFATMIAAERHFQSGIVQLEGHIEGAMWMAWHQLRFSGDYPEIGTFDQWVRTVANFQVVSPEGAIETEAEVEPTTQPPPAAPPKAEPPSPIHQPPTTQPEIPQRRSTPPFAATTEPATAPMTGTADGGIPQPE